jgi:hypothetical protein
MSLPKQTLDALAGLARRMTDSAEPAAWDCLVHLAQFAGKLLSDEWSQFDVLRRRHEIRVLANRLNSPAVVSLSLPALQSERERLLRLLKQLEATENKRG